MNPGAVQFRSLDGARIAMMRPFVNVTDELFRDRVGCINPVMLHYLVFVDDPAEDVVAG